MRDTLLLMLMPRDGAARFDTPAATAAMAYKLQI